MVKIFSYTISKVIRYFKSLYASNFVVHDLPDASHNIRSVVGLAGVGISKPIQYFEWKTDLYSFRGVFLLAEVKLGQFEYLS